MKFDFRIVKKAQGISINETLKYVFKYSFKAADIMDEPDFLYGMTS